LKGVPPPTKEKIAELKSAAVEIADKAKVKEWPVGA
jgi:hypothetical protein